jgi:uncharacterized protein (TIGR02246 family)
MRISAILPFLACVLFGTSFCAADGVLTASDIAKIRQVHRQYQLTWLNGDSDGVRDLFTDDSVLLPPHSGTPRLGREGMNAFWFPPGTPPTRVTKLEVVINDIGGDGEIAYVWGTDDVTWVTGQNGTQTTASHHGTFLNVLKKQPNGEWKISHHMWDDKIEKN